MLWQGRNDNASLWTTVNLEVAESYHHACEDADANIKGILADLCIELQVCPCPESCLCQAHHCMPPALPSCGKAVRGMCLRPAQAPVYVQLVTACQQHCPASAKLCAACACNTSCGKGLRSTCRHSDPDILLAFCRKSMRLLCTWRPPWP